MSILNFADLESFEELDDADLATVIGGTAIVGSAVDTVTATNSAFGNGAQPTSGTVILVGTTLVNAGTYLIRVGNGTEEGLQSANGGVAKTAKSL